MLPEAFTPRLSLKSCGMRWESSSKSWRPRVPEDSSSTFSLHPFPAAARDGFRKSRSDLQLELVELAPLARLGGLAAASSYLAQYHIQSCVQAAEAQTLRLLDQVIVIARVQTPGDPALRVALRFSLSCHGFHLQKSKYLVLNASQ